ncbi:MAG: hypothetical protein EA378_05805 [Phycisphaerales bacterium]|nr:MAG: hypothetical protein EA378_05805 [Phycisphaerales bacterium]
MAALASASLLLATGCGGTRLQVYTDPSMTDVVARTPSGQVVRGRGEPPTFRIRFREGETAPAGERPEAYTIIATPDGPDADRYLTTEFPVTRTSLLAARQIRPVPDKPDTFRLDLDLPRKDYEDLAFAEIVLDPRGGWTTVITRRRAYDDVTERGGTAPQRIARVPASTGLRGMSMSPAGDRMVYSISETEPGDAGAAAAGVTFRTPGREPAHARVASDPNVSAVTRSNLRGIRLAGGGIEQITVDDYFDFDPTFTSDGEHLIFASNRRNLGGSDILRIRSTARAGGIQNIYTDPQGNWLVRPTQGADGTIAFNMIPAARDGERDYTRPPEIWTIGGPGRFPTQVTLGLQPAISPSGDKIAFIRDGNVWVCNADGTSEAQLTTDASRIISEHLASLPEGEARERFQREELFRTYFPYSHPSWSPDGRFIVYTSMQGQDPTGRRQEDVWVMDADGGMREQLTTNPSADRYPLVSPDGRNIYFFSNRGREWAIWRIPSPEFMRSTR